MKRSSRDEDGPDEGRARWRVLTLLAVGELMIMSLWFSASAVVPQLTIEWGLDDGQQSWLTMSVQLGFVAGALTLALLNVADRIAAQRLVLVSALAGAAANLLIVLGSPPLSLVLGLRFATGACLAGVYPPGMKLLVSWFDRARGFAIGVLVGAITVGSALPHLFNVLPLAGAGTGLPPWRTVLVFSSSVAVVGALLVGGLVRQGPNVPASSPFDWRQATRGFTEESVRRANFGYLGHMWELYAMWSWVPLLLLATYRSAGLGEAAGRIAGFAAVAVGGLGCVVAGLLADRWGRTRVASASLAISGSCALVAGFLTEAPGILTVVCLVWGFAVVADSAQFSAAVSELCDPRYVGTALTMQTCVGFLLTMVTIRLVPVLVDVAGWGGAFAVLAPGPAFGIYHMMRLRRMPESRRMASGHG